MEGSNFTGQLGSSSSVSAVYIGREDSAEYLFAVVENALNAMMIFYAPDLTDATKTYFYNAEYAGLTFGQVGEAIIADGSSKSNGASFLVPVDDAQISYYLTNTSPINNAG